MFTYVRCLVAWHAAPLLKRSRVVVGLDVGRLTQFESSFSRAVSHGTESMNGCTSGASTTLLEAPSVIVRLDAQ